MKKSNKLFVFVLFALISTIFLTHFVSAAPEFLSKASDIFTQWENGEQIGENITKYLFWLVVGLIIFAVLSKIPLLENENMLWIRGLLSIVISFLSIAYLTPQDLYVMLASYNAMGVVMGGIIPFIIIAYFSTGIMGKENAGARLMSKFVWILFIIYLIYKLFWGWSEDLISGATAWIYVTLIIIAILYVFFFERKLIAMMFKEEIDSEIESIDKHSKKVAVGEIASMRRRATDLIAAGQTDAGKELMDSADSLERSLK